MSSPAEIRPGSGLLDNYRSIGIFSPAGTRRGAYQAGALKAIHDFLCRHNVHGKVRMIAGTSIGSWNALFWLAGLLESGDSQKCGLEKWWSNLSFLGLVRPTVYCPGLYNYFLSPGPWRKNFDKRSHGGGGYA